jgi:hypothetical protein
VTNEQCEENTTVTITENAPILLESSFLPEIPGTIINKNLDPIVVTILNSQPPKKKFKSGILDLFIYDKNIVSQSILCVKLLFHL